MTTPIKKYQPARKRGLSASLFVLSVSVVASSSLYAQQATSDHPGYLNWYPKSLLSTEELAKVPEFCSGSYRISDIPALSDERIEVEADSSTREKNGDTHFSGDVEFKQHNRILTGQQASWFPNSESGFFRGDVMLRSPLLTLHGEQAELAADGMMTFSAAEYAVPQRHLRGSADTLSSPGDGRFKLENATLTFCEPQSNDWDIAASELEIDQNTGVGTAWHARVRVADVPVMYLPYYRFPVGDQRTTGFLDPQIAVNGKLQAEDIQLPFYLNIAPNLDATITPHHILDRGLVWEGQLRHKTRLLGDGQLNVGYLGEDDLQQKEYDDFNNNLPDGATNQKESDERFLINYTQAGRISQHWQHRWQFNKVSDSDYFNDMDPTGPVDRTTHLPSRGEIFFDQDAWHFDVMAESYQTIDDSIALKDRPYRRLPELDLSYQPTVLNDWKLEQQLQYTQFSRKDEDEIDFVDQELSGFDALNGRRLLSETALSYPMEWPFGFLAPKAEYRYRNYELLDADESVEANDEIELNSAHGIGRYSLDAGLYFDRDFEWFNSDYQQTLEPRVFWVKSPYLAGQEYIPNFDTATRTVTYSTLFTGDRFSGGDRLADLDQVSVGLTSRFIRDDGLEQFRASIGRIYYNEDRRVQLDPTSTLPAENTQSTSSTLGEVEWNPFEQLSLYHTLEWDPYEDYAKQRRYGLRFETQQNRMLNIATNTVQNYNDTNDRFDVETKQLDWGFFWAINQSWGLVGRQLRDLRSYDSDEARPVSDVLESLAGFEYQNCCWRFQLLYRESSSSGNDSEDFSTDKRYGFILSVQLKGLTTIGGGSDALIEDAVTGYSRRQYHDY